VLPLRLSVRYHKPVYISKGKVKLVARVERVQKRLVDIKTELFDSDNNLCTEAIVQYFTYPEKIAREKYGYPGIENFL